MSNDKTIEQAAVKTLFEEAAKSGEQKTKSKFEKHLDGDVIQETKPETPPPVEPAKPAETEKTQDGNSFSFSDFKTTQPSDVKNVGANDQPGTGNVLATQNKNGVAKTKTVIGLFEKILDILCEYKHGLHLEEIGAKPDDKDLKLASELAGEAQDRGEMPQIPNWVVLLCLAGLVFGVPIYKVATYSPKVKEIHENAEHPDINPRSGKPYVRGRYDKGNKKKGK